MVKLVVVIMGPGNENFLPMCRASVEGADRVLYFTSNPSSSNLMKGDTYFNQWDESDKNTNGKARNVYLKHLKENYPNDWCLVLDEDEICEDINKVKEFIQTACPGLYYPKMRHFIGDLGHEDASRPVHFVPNRLFKIDKAGEYPLDSHPVLLPKEALTQITTTDCTTIWHLGHLPVEYMKYISKRYSEHVYNSNMHSKDFLKAWRDGHLFGTYPKSQINLTEIPKVILDNFGIDFDELYFKNRGIELKHSLMVRQWYEFFGPTSVLDLGCGLGPYIYFWKWFTVCRGIEKNRFAVDNALTTDIKQGDITKREDMEIWHSDLCEYGNVHSLITAIDVLEHLKYKDLDKAIDNIIEFAEKILVSIPFKGDPNLEADPTHIIKEDRDWWVKQFTSKGLKEVEVPSHFLFRDQLLIFEK